MKIKEVISQTELTDRAIRLYIENGLVAPCCSENYKGRKSFEFSESDVESLKNIAALRKAGFSIAQIKIIKEGGEECRKTVSEFIEKTAERIEADNVIMNSLQTLVHEDDISLKIICDRLNMHTAQKHIPAEDIKPSHEEKVEKAVMLTILSISLCMALAYCFLIVEFYNSEFLYIRIYNWLKLSLVIFIPIAMIICYSLLIRSYIKPKKILVKQKYHRIKTVILAIIIIAVSGLGIPLSFLPILSPCVYSQTEDADNYLIVDRGVRHWNEDIYSLFPANIPESVIEEYSYYNSEYNDSVKYFYRYNNDFELDFDIVAQWLLPTDEFYREKQRALEGIGKITYQAIKGNWNCIYYCDFDEGIKECYYFKIFAYNEKTHTVRYILSYSLEKNEPYYLSLDWS